MHVTEAPATREELGAALAAAAEAGTSVRFRGGGTKQDWPPAAPSDAIELSTTGLNSIVEHNAGDLTAVLEPGVLLADAQALFAKEGQRLALDPPDLGATVGGVVASGDTGPLRGRYGGPRDLVV
ncbi:MAG TPA: FAD-binding protein, partial [Thermoleophilaceae bacterium]